MKTDTSTFAAGCFWGVQAEFDKVNGVVTTTVGYAGGHTKKPTYRDVCSDTTGHAEAVQVVFDPTVVTYEQLLDKFWSIHDPTTPNQQGPDFGSQYRSAIFYHSPAQQAAALASKAELEKSGKYRRPVVTEIVPAVEFWPAEEYHQKYFQKHGGGTCHTR
ncbi:MAG: peptide-methionine (S)-S-oxide reductase MsrA [candidate division WOR-3 bacterium]|nr:peptide-methionine (S)-S-oxide reductase MsrA [candidate division WOR-3 bacterium]